MYMRANELFTLFGGKVRESHIEGLLTRVELQLEEVREVLGNEVLGGSRVREGMRPLLSNARLEEKAICCSRG